MRAPILFAIAAALIASGVLHAVSFADDRDSAIERELDQNWDANFKKHWEAAPQGSRLIPLEWLKALPQPASDSPFLDPEHMARFGYLQPTAPSNHGLPAGFAVDTVDNRELVRTKLNWKAGQRPTEPWVGLTCAACHTAEFTYRTAPSAAPKSVRVFGGPSLSDFQSFVDTLNEALRATKASPIKWDRFASQVLKGPDDTPSNRSMLSDTFDKLLTWQEREAAINKVDIAYGFGRVDAFGRIYNKVSLLTGAAKPRNNPPDAPVSFPYLWRVPQLDRVQHNGIAPKLTIGGMPFDFGALARNTGEVIGVFGDVNPTGGGGLSGFPTSVNVGNLARIEEMLTSLRPPKWPASAFGAVDDKLAHRGKALYDQHCSNCHMLIDRTKSSGLIKVEMALFDGTAKLNSDPNKRMAAPGTDPWMACNAYAYSTPSGVFEGVPAFYVAGSELLKSEEPNARLLTTMVAGTLAGQKLTITQEAVANLFRIQRLPSIAVREAPLPNPRRSPEKTAQLERCLSEKSPNLGYISRPLNGIWATGPYLHNGSVPSLYDLLLPPAQRPKKFYVGTKEFDPVNVGLATSQSAPGNSFLFETHDSAGNEIDGNTNAGHDYGNDRLSDADRRALLEFLKSL